MTFKRLQNYSFQHFLYLKDEKNEDGIIFIKFRFLKNNNTKVRICVFFLSFNIAQFPTN